MCPRGCTVTRERSTCGGRSVETEMFLPRMLLHIHPHSKETIDGRVSIQHSTMENQHAQRRGKISTETILPLDAVRTLPAVHTASPVVQWYVHVCV